MNMPWRWRGMVHFNREQDKVPWVITQARLLWMLKCLLNEQPRQKIWSVFFFSQMTILYLHYCAIYPPQVVLWKENRKKRTMCLVMWQRHSVFPSPLMHSRRAVQQEKYTKLIPSGSAEAVFHAELSLEKWPHNNYWQPVGHECKSLSSTFAFCVPIFPLSVRHCLKGRMSAQHKKTSNTISTQERSNGKRRKKENKKRFQKIPEETKHLMYTGPQPFLFGNVVTRPQGATKTEA